MNWTKGRQIIDNSFVSDTIILMVSHMKRLSAFVIIIILVVGLVGCTVIAYDLTISSTGGGSVTVPGEGTTTYGEGEVVNLEATPDAGYRFVNWSGDVDDIADVEDATTTITMNDSYSITANFEEIHEDKYDLIISSTVGGEVTVPSEGIFMYDGGTVVDLVATPDAGYRFLTWSGDVDSLANVNDATTTITMNNDSSITANFEEGEPVTFIDPNLEAAIREAIGKVTGSICRWDLEGLTSLSASERNIADLTGLEYCTNLTELDLRGNEISDISPLVQNEGLGEGDTIGLQGNPLSWESVNIYIPELRGRGVTVVYDEQGVTGNVTVIPNCEGMMAEYTIIFDIHASLSSGVHSITIWFPEGTTVPQADWQTGEITVNGQGVFGVDVTVVGTKVTFFVPQHVASGIVTVVFKEEAGIVNPPAGSYYLYVNTSRAPDSIPRRVGPY